MKPPLDAWLRQTTNLENPTLESLRQWQLGAARDILAMAKAASPFYMEHLKDVDPDAVRTHEDLAKVPRITALDLRERPEALVCGSQDEIARAVSLQSSGTTGPGKRLFFAAEDLEATVEFFRHGMGLITPPGSTVLILLPGGRPDSVGLLLAEAVRRMGGHGLVHGPLTDPEAALEAIRRESPACLVGTPAQLNVLAACWEARRLGPDDSPVRSALVCWDSVPDAVCRNLQRIMGCRVHRHWGMVETGLGGAVECSLGSGAHLREADLLVEITDPDTGRPLPDGEWGEITVTTLRRKTMPLVRYRTGDQGRILPEPCACGSPLRLLDPDVRRLDSGNPHGLGLPQLNEALYSLPGLADFTAGLEGGSEHPLLRLTVCAAGERGDLAERVRETVMALDRPTPGQAPFRVEIDFLNHAGPAEPGLAKRRLRTGMDTKAGYER